MKDKSLRGSIGPVGNRAAPGRVGPVGNGAASRPVVRARETRSAGAGGASPQVQKALAPIRRSIYPHTPFGHHARIRLWMVLLTQAIFYGLPWLQWQGRQAVLLDLGARRFTFFGLVLWPQDMFYLVVLVGLAALVLFLFTVLAGRLFCGYACPQTIYTEIFVRIEQWIEGDRLARIRLDGEPWGLRKLRLKLIKHALWLAIGLWTGYTFIGYFVPIREVGAHLLTLTLSPWQWFWMLFYALATWGNAGFMREAVCKYMCPYARSQRAMVDDDTLIVTYDAARGEPRGGALRGLGPRDAGMGDCVDCSLCVQVCPTGIDIRDGLQDACIGCGACIDACDSVMDKMGYEHGLIRYTSRRAVEEHLSPSAIRRRMLRPRVLAYAALVLVLSVGFVYSLATRTSPRAQMAHSADYVAFTSAGCVVRAGPAPSVTTGPAAGAPQTNREMACVDAI